MRTVGGKALAHGGDRRTGKGLEDRPDQGMTPDGIALLPLAPLLLLVQGRFARRVGDDDEPTGAGPLPEQEAKAVGEIRGRPGSRAELDPPRLERYRMRVFLEL